MIQGAPRARAAIWVARAHDVPDAEQVLASDERVRAARFFRAADRFTWTASRALLRRALTAVEPSIDPLAWRFRAESRGRPALDPPRGLDFNVSHTAGWVAVVVTRGARCGVDVEAWRPIVVDELAPGVLCAAERVAVASVAPAERPGVFFDRWVVKEAWSKALGGGLSLPVDRVNVDPDGPTVAFLPPLDDDPERWTFRIWRPAACVSAALAVCAPHVCFEPQPMPPARAPGPGGSFGPGCLD